MAAAGSCVVSAHQLKIELTFPNGLLPSSSILKRSIARGMSSCGDVRFQKLERNRHWRYVRLCSLPSSLDFYRKQLSIYFKALHFFPLHTSISRKSAHAKIHDFCQPCASRKRRIHDVCLPLFSLTQNQNLSRTWLLIMFSCRDLRRLKASVGKEHVQVYSLALPHRIHQKP
jgi:hypothetical protein